MARPGPGIPPAIPRQGPFVAPIRLPAARGSAPGLRVSLRVRHDRPGPSTLGGSERPRSGLDSPGTHAPGFRRVRRNSQGPHGPQAVPCPKRLLVLGDHAQSADRIGPSLRDVFRPLEALGVEVIAAESLEGAAGELEKNDVDVLVVDPVIVGGGEGQARATLKLKMLRRWLEQTESRRAAGASLPPILVVSDPVDPIPAVVAGRMLLQTRTWDIARRDASPEELLLRTEHLVAQARSAAELERVRYEASHDDRTGLLRPRAFEESLRAHFSAAQRHRLQMALVLVDMDNFGEVNKRFDHTVGDDLIGRAGSVIRMSLREEDVGARIGGDEFALILPYTQRVAAARVVSRLTGRFRALSGPAPRSAGGDGSSIQVSASLGFETFDGGDVDDPEQLRRRAERALGVAKARGGDQGVYFRNLDDHEREG